LCVKKRQPNLNRQFNLSNSNKLTVLIEQIANPINIISDRILLFAPDHVKPRNAALVQILIGTGRRVPAPLQPIAINLATRLERQLNLGLATLPALGNFAAMGPCRTTPTITMATIIRWPSLCVYSAITDSLSRQTYRTLES